MRNADFRPCYQKSWALVIGINQYHHVNPLALARADAESVAESLVSELGFPKDNVISLLDDQATRAAITQKFLGFENLGPDDRLFVFFAGHGETVTGQRGDVGYLIPVDGNVDDKSTLIPWHELTRGSEIIPAKHILFVMDACYSGLAIQRGSRSGGQRFISDMLQRVSRQVITAGKADEPVADGGSATGQNSIFTGHLLDGLRGKAANEKGVLTASYLMHHVYEKVATDPQSHQTPHYGHFQGDGDFILRTPDNGHVSVQLGEDFLVATLPEKPEPQAIATLTEIRPVFADKIGYSDPEAEVFGRNEWSLKLGRFKWSGDGKSDVVPASHWLALVVEPVSNQPVNFDLASLARSVRHRPPESDKPFEQFRMPTQALTTGKSVILFNIENPREGGQEERWKRFVRIDRNGGIEYCEFAGVANTPQMETGEQPPRTPIKVFSYIQVIGLVWNFIFTSKKLYQLAGYEGGVRYFVNLVGAKDTRLIQFSQEAGVEDKHWHNPFQFEAMMGGGLENWRCRDDHFQSVFQIALGSMREPEVKKLIVTCAQNLGLAYNHQSSPRCFNYGTDIFPWQSFDPDRHLRH